MEKLKRWQNVLLKWKVSAGLFLLIFICMQKAAVESMKEHFKVYFVICSAERAWSWNVIPTYGFQNFMQSQIVS